MLQETGKVGRERRKKGKQGFDYVDVEENENMLGMLFSFKIEFQFFFGFLKRIYIKVIWHCRVFVNIRRERKKKKEVRHVF